MIITSKRISETGEQEINLQRKQILEDIYTAYLSRFISNDIRKEVLSGKAKFGIGSAGKELHQLVVANYFEKGDFYSGYYRDMTMALATGVSTATNIYGTVYGDANNDPFSGGRQMNNHFTTSLFDESGKWNKQVNQYNFISPMASLGGHLPHALGIAAASKIFREQGRNDHLSRKGNEISFANMGDATAAEGVFFETVNAAGVIKVPLAIIIQDDGFGISVPTELQTTKGNISEILEGFRVNSKGQGIDIYTAKAWDYEGLHHIFSKGIKKMRETHIPAVFHIQECTQPNGHSTSGSHERYKTKERLQWEKDFDCIKIMESWIIENGLASQSTLDEIKAKAKTENQKAKKEAWAAFQQAPNRKLKEFRPILAELKKQSDQPTLVIEAEKELKELYNTTVSDVIKVAEKLKHNLWNENNEAFDKLVAFIQNGHQYLEDRYGNHLHSESPIAALKVPAVPAVYVKDEKLKGYEVLNRYFDHKLGEMPNLHAFGEDVGKIGGVNQSFAGLQAKHGENRVFDTGIREWTIVGQGIGMAMRGLRPIAEIQYLDYLSYAFSALTDNLATLRYRTVGQQAAPMVVRTRGHRLEGIWHSGSPMGMLINSMKGIFVLTPRNMVQAVGLYNTMMKSDDCALMIESLNGYRLWEKVPTNLEDYTVPLGVPDILREGTDVTLVTYGSCVRIAEKAVDFLATKGISVELIDAQTLLPFDRHHVIVESIKKTNRIVFIDEDVPGGGTAFMMQKVLEEQNGYRWLDSKPETITGAECRPPYGNDGDYYSKPYEPQIIELISDMMREAGEI